MKEKEFNARYKLQSSDFWPRWGEELRTVFQIPDHHSVPEERWPNRPDELFCGGYELAFIKGDVLIREEPFKAFVRFLESINETVFVYATRPFQDHANLYYEFPVDIPYRQFEAGPPSSPATWGGTRDHYLFGSTVNWGFYYLEAFSIYIAGCSERTALKALQEAFSFEGRNAELGESIVGKGFNEYSLQQALGVREIVDEIRDSQWCTALPRAVLDIARAAGTKSELGKGIQFSLENLGKAERDALFKQLIKGGELTKKGAYRLGDGTIIHKWFSAKTDQPTLKIDLGDENYLIRFGPIDN